MIRGKLTHSAGIWFDNNESSFHTWADFETAFRNRYFPTNLADTTFAKLKARTQQPGESFTSYSDDVIELCRDSFPDLPDEIIIRHLMSGLQPHLKFELSRRESSIHSLDDFLKYAQITQDLYDTYKSSQASSLVSQPSPLLSNQATISSVAMINTQSPPRHPTPRQNHHSSSSTATQKSTSPHHSLLTSRAPHTNTPRRSHLPSNSQSRNYNNRRQPTSHSSFSKCKVCGRTNHRTIDCFHKRATGCFNCGNNHQVRDCTLPPNFQ